MIGENIIYLAATKSDIGAKQGQIYILTFRAVTSSAAETEMKNLIFSIKLVGRGWNEGLTVFLG